MARVFNGTTQYLERTSAAITALPVTFSCWIYATSVSRFQAAMVVSRATASPEQDLFRLIVYNTNVIEAASFIGATPTVATTTGTISVNTWHHIAATFSATAGQHAWLDGAKSASGGNSRAAASLNRTSIGRQIVNSTQFFPFAGHIAEAAIYSDVLTDAEIVGLRRGLSPIIVRPDKLRAYWPLGGRYGQYDVDRWNGGFDLTSFNAPTWADHYRVSYPQPAMQYLKAAAGGGATPWLYARRRSQIIGAGGVH